MAGVTGDHGSVFKSEKRMRRLCVSQTFAEEFVLLL
jgi:hypothetical protein